MQRDAASHGVRRRADPPGPRGRACLLWRGEALDRTLPAMDPMVGKVAMVAAVVAMFAVRAPHVRRAARIKVVRAAGGGLDAVLVALVAVGLLGAPLLWVLTSMLDRFDHELLPVAFAAGLLVHAAGLWLLWRSHVDLGANWSNTLQIRENQSLVTNGVYRRVRHPMYTALLLFGVGQALVAGNWIAGPAFLAAFTALVASRIAREEQLMLDQFGEAYAEYRARTSRFLPALPALRQTGP